MDIVKIRVPWRDDLMNVKILFSCWPKYLYTHIWPQNIEKWGKTVILLVKWWISNFRPPSGGLSFGACGTARGFDKLYPLNRTHVFRKNQRWTPWMRTRCPQFVLKFGRKTFFIVYHFVELSFIFCFHFVVQNIVFLTPSHIFKQKSWSQFHCLSQME